MSVRASVVGQRFIGVCSLKREEGREAMGQRSRHGTAHHHQPHRRSDHQQIHRAAHHHQPHRVNHADGVVLFYRLANAHRINYKASEAFWRD